MDFKGIFLKQDNVSFLHKKVVNLYITWKLDTWSKDLSTNFTLGNYLFGVVKVTKNADPDKCKYSGFGIGFDSCPQFSRIDESNQKKKLSFLELIIVLLCRLMLETKIT